MYVRSSLACLYAFPLALLVLSLPLTSHARSVGRSEFQAFLDLSTGSTKHTVGMGGDGTPIITHGVPGPTAVGNMNISHLPGGLPTATGTADLATPIARKTLPITAKQKFTSAGMASALGHFAQKVIAPLSVGLAIFDLAKEINYLLVDDPNSDDNKFLKQVDGSQCVITGTGANGMTLSQFKESLCPSTATTGTFQCNVNFSVGPSSCSISVQPDFFPSSGSPPVIHQNSALWNSGAPLQQPQFVDVGMDQFIADLASQSGWPSTSSIDRSLADAVNGGQPLITDEENGFAIASPVTKVSSDPLTTTASDGSTKTDVTSCAWVADLSGIVNYQCSTVTTTSTPAKTETQTVVTTNPDGTTSTQTVTKTTPSSTSTSTTTGTDPSKIGGCDTGSGTIGCSTFGTPTASDTLSKSTKNITISPVAFSGGSCPAPITVLAFNRSYAFEYTPLCSRLQGLAPLFLALASLAAAWILADSFKVS